MRGWTPLLALAACSPSTIDVPLIIRAPAELEGCTLARHVRITSAASGEPIADYTTNARIIRDGDPAVQVAATSASDTDRWILELTETTDCELVIARGSAELNPSTGAILRAFTWDSVAACPSAAPLEFPSNRAILFNPCLPGVCATELSPSRCANRVTLEDNLSCAVPVSTIDLRVEGGNLTSPECAHVRDLSDEAATKLELDCASDCSVVLESEAKPFAEALGAIDVLALAGCPPAGELPYAIIGAVELPSGLLALGIPACGKSVLLEPRVDGGRIVATYPASARPLFFHLRTGRLIAHENAALISIDPDDFTTSQWIAPFEVAGDSTMLISATLWLADRNVLVVAGYEGLPGREDSIGGAITAFRFSETATAATRLYRRGGIEELGYATGALERAGGDRYTIVENTSPIGTRSSFRVRTRDVLSGDASPAWPEFDALPYHPRLIADPDGDGLIFLDGERARRCTIGGECDRGVGIWSVQGYVTVAISTDARLLFGLPRSAENVLVAHALGDLSRRPGAALALTDMIDRARAAFIVSLDGETLYVINERIDRVRIAPP